MKKNTYDDEKFFMQYSAMDRSTKGLAGAGEWHALQPLLPDFSGKRVLDLGCGFGWHCRYAAEQGASYVLGVDSSRKMLAVARENTPFDTVEYRLSGIEDFAFPENGFNTVISSLALHYVKDFHALCRKVKATLTPGGSFVFSVEHPIFTAQGPQDWHHSDTGDRAHWPVDGYFSEGERSAVFLGETVAKYHKTITTYVNGLVKAGFSITALVEPQPDPAMMDIPGMADEMRRPMMLIVTAKT